jgi:trigger factor
MEDEIGEGKPLVCEATFEVIPEVSLPELESIEVEKLRPRLTDEMFERAVRDLQAYHSTLNTVKRPVGEGDVVSATSVVFAVDSNERQKWENTPQKNVFDLAEPALRSEVKDALVGKIPGEKTSAEFVVDKAHKDKRIAGKKIHYDITIDQVEERVFPETTNEFYRQVLNVDLDSEEALREELKKRLLTQLDEEYRGQAILSAIDQIVEKSELEVPDALLSRQIQRQKQQDAEACKQRFDLDIEEYLRNASVSPADYEWEVREKSINNIRRTLVLDAMRKKFEVEVDRDDLETEIIRMANAYQTKPENIKAAYYKNQDQLRQLTDELCYLKLATVVQEKIKVKEVDELSVKTPQAAEITAAPSANSETTEKGE